MRKRDIKKKFDSVLYEIYNFESFFDFLFLNSSAKKLLKKNQSIKELYKNEKCFILGNGPSLKDEKLDLIKNKEIFAVNYFIKNVFFPNIYPTFYCLIDAVWLKRKYRDDFINILNKVKKSTILTRYQAKKIIDNNKMENKVYYTYYNKILTNKSANYINLSRNIPIPYNSIIYCLFWALYLGFSEIYLLGCDFNSFCSKKLVHSYSDESKDNHVSLGLRLEVSSDVYFQHEIIKKVADKKGVKIFNCYEESLLDVYPYKGLEDAVF